MKIIGLITEYNPFHNGHLYHLTKSKQLAAADYTVVLMSGSFVQRGAPAVYDKYVRTAMALSGGADLVLEMPAAFSTASAKEFATYGISMFTRLRAVDALYFGSECGDGGKLQSIAALLADEPEAYSLCLRTCMKDGMTFPEARQKAISTFLDLDSQKLLDSPNNLLGIEYMKAALLLDSPLSLQTIRRAGSDYHDESLQNDEPLCSASAVRRSLEDKKEIEKLITAVPPCTYDFIRRETPLFSEDFSQALNYRIWLEAAAQSPQEHLADFADMTPELAARLLKNAMEFDSFENRIQFLKTRQLTYTRASRALLHLLLNMKTQQTERFKADGYASYARILGFKKSAAPLLSILKEKSEIPLIGKLADAKTLLSPTAWEMLSQEIAAAHLYQSVKKEKGCAFKNEFTQPLIILP